MVLKIAIPGKMQFKMMRREPYLLHRKGDVHYIGGAEVLPPPLPSEQENQVIGDLGTEYEDEAKAILIEHNLRLVVYIAKKFDNTGVGVEDLMLHWHHRTDRVYQHLQSGEEYQAGNLCFPVH